MIIADIVTADSKTIIGCCPICNGFAKLWELVGYPIYAKTMSNNIKMLHRKLNPDNLLMHCSKYKKSYPFRKIRDYCFVPAGNMVIYKPDRVELTFTEEEMTMLKDYLLKPRAYLESDDSLKLVTIEGLNTFNANVTLSEALERSMAEIERLEDANFVRFVQERVINGRLTRSVPPSPAPRLFNLSAQPTRRMPLGEAVATEQVILEGGEIGRIHT